MPPRGRPKKIKVEEKPEPATTSTDSTADSTTSTAASTPSKPARRTALKSKPKKNTTNDDNSLKSIDNDNNNNDNNNNNKQTNILSFFSKIAPQPPPPSSPSPPSLSSSSSPSPSDDEKHNNNSKKNRKQTPNKPSSATKKVTGKRKQTEQKKNNNDKEDKSEDDDVNDDDVPITSVDKKKQKRITAYEAKEMVVDRGPGKRQIKQGGLMALFRAVQTIKSEEGDNDDDQSSGISSSDSSMSDKDSGDDYKTESSEEDDHEDTESEDDNTRKKFIVSESESEQLSDESEEEEEEYDDDDDKPKRKGKKGATPSKRNQTPKKTTPKKASTPSKSLSRATPRTSTKRRKSEKIGVIEANIVPQYSSDKIRLMEDQIPSSELELIEDFEEYLQTDLESIEIRYDNGNTKKDSDSFKLQRFESTLHPVSDGEEIIMFCGGSIRSLSWCPLDKLHSKLQYLAVACNRNTVDTHKDSKVYNNGGKSMIQIWEFDTADENSIPSLLFGLAHNGEYVVDMKWMPNGCLAHKSKIERLGILVVSYGDGTVKAYSLPPPSDVKMLKKNPIVLNIKPFFDISLTRFDKNIRGTCLDITIKDFNIFLLIGCNNGLILIYDIQNLNPNPIFLKKVSYPAISVSWCPHNSFLFSTLHSQVRYLWDRRDLNSINEKLMNFSWTSKMIWFSSKLPVVLVSEDDNLRIHDAAKSQSAGTKISNSHVLDFDISQNGLCAVTTASGELINYYIHFITREYGADPLIHLSNQSIDNGVLVLSYDSYSSDFPLEFQAPSYRAGSGMNQMKVIHSFDFPPQQNYLTNVSWNKNESTDRWLALGGTLGVIRCRLVS